MERSNINTHKIIFLNILEGQNINIKQYFQDRTNQTLDRETDWFKVQLKLINSVIIKIKNSIIIKNLLILEYNYII